MMTQGAGSPAADGALRPPPEAVARFAGDLAPLRAASGPLALAVSGGPDSLALLLLAAAALPGAVEAATVDHRLRPEAAEEAAAVARLCARLGVPHRILPVDVAAGNLQAQARAARYAAMAVWMEERGLAALATAHHADDQAETLLLRLNRASGVAGLAGARARTVVPGTPLALLRPLLGWRRAELGRIVADAGVCPACDPANTDERFDRARIRKALASADWLDVPAIAASAAHLADADEALDWAAMREWRDAVRREPLGMVYAPRAPRAIALRVMARIFAEMGESPPRGGAIARAFDTLLLGSPASVGEGIVRPGPAGWSFARAPRRRNTAG